MLECGTGQHGTMAGKAGATGETFTVGYRRQYTALGEGRRHVVTATGIEWHTE